MQQNQILDSRAVYVDEIGIPTAGWNLIQNEDEHEIAYWEPWAFDSDEEIYTPEFLPLPGSQVLLLECPIFEALYHGNRGPGKRLEVSEPVLTSRGWIKAQEVTLSDKLVAVDGTYTDVLDIYPGYDEDYYCITFNDGTQINACKDHLWSVYDQKNGPKEGFKVRNSEWIFNSKSRIGVPYLTAAVAGINWKGPDAYLVGLMLGDGTMGSKYPTLYSADEEIVRYTEKLGWSVYKYKIWRAVAVKNAISQPFRELLGDMGKAGDKYVPEALMVADSESRLACLQGLMDSDGTIEKVGNKCRFVSKSEKLAQCVAQLVRSLGGKARCYKENRKSPKGGVDWRWRVNLNARDMFIPFRLKRKADRVMPPSKRVPMVKYIDNIEPIGKRAGVCFTVAHNEHLFVARNYTITHNTITLLMDFAKEVGKGYGSSWRGILFRRHFKDLDDVVKKIEEFFPKMWPGFRFLKSKSEYMAIWPTGEALLLRHIEKKDDYDSYHGHEYPWIGWEELTQWADDKVFNLMQSCCRSSAPGIPCRVRSTTNPYGCVKEGDILTTDRGWIPIQDIKGGEKIYSVTEDGKIVEAVVSHTIRKQWSGNMIERKGRGIFMEFTEDHRLPHLNTNKTKHIVKRFDQLPGDAYIRRTGDDWTGKQIRRFNVSDTSIRKNKIQQPLSMNGNNYAEFMGWFLSEGWTMKRDNCFGISQIKQPQKDQIQNLLDRIGFKYGYTGNSFVIYSKSWFDYLVQFGKCRDKYVPEKLKKATSKQLQIFMKAAMAGDGHRTSSDMTGQYYTASEQLADDMCDISVKLGMRTYLSSRQRENRDGLSYAVNISENSPIVLHTGNHLYDVDTTCVDINITKEEFIGEVYCLTVPGTETFFIRQKGCVWLSGNSGHNWVKKRYQLPRSDGKVIRIPGQMPRVAIRGALRENFLLLQNQPHYETIIANAAKNPAQAKAWIKGDWDVTSGGMIDDLWNDRVHVIPNIPAGTIPRSWTITRAYDHGQSHPFSVGWWLQSSGEPITINNRIIGNVRGDLILWMEWYGTTGEPNTGVRMRATKIAEGILDREEDENVLGRVLDGPADTEIYTNVATGTGRGPADDMEDAGVTWERADKSRGSRKRGWEKLRELIEQSLPGKDGTRDKPGLFICTKCKYWLDLVPVMPRDETDPDEIPSTYEDHICDMTRYRITWVLMGMFRKGF